MFERMTILQNRLMTLLLAVACLLCFDVVSAQTINKATNQLTVIEKPSIFSQLLNGTEIATNKKVAKKPDTTYRSELDSIESKNSITKIWNRVDEFTVEVAIEDQSAQIKLVAYNMFGKKVLDIFDFSPVGSNLRQYRFNATSLPNGVYLCVLEGNNFRDVEKFIVSR